MKPKCYHQEEYAARPKATQKTIPKLRKMTQEPETLTRGQEKETQETETILISEAAHKEETTHKTDNSHQ
jgi:hypothetical protein